MKQYSVYIHAFGNKFKFNCEAENEEHARYKALQQIEFVKFVEVEQTYNSGSDVPDFLQDIFKGSV